MGDEMSDNLYLVGSAIVNDASKISIADESVFSFMGVAYSFNFVDYIHEDYKEAFLTELGKAEYDNKISFISKVRRYDGKFFDVAVVLQRVDIDGNKYIGLEIYDVNYMALEYKNFVADKKIHTALLSISDKIYFKYEVKKDYLEVQKAGKVVYSGGMKVFKETVLYKKLVSQDGISHFNELCDSIVSAKGAGFYKFDSQFFGSEDKTTYYPTTISYTTIELNSQVEYMVGLASGQLAGADAQVYASNSANLDPLTGLLNKKAIKELTLDSLANAKKNGRPVTIAIIDLDNFKAINDTFGHMFGDSTLLNVARIMREAVGNRGTVGRIGGDEFFIVLTDFEDGDASIRPLIRSIRSHVAWYFKDKTENIKVTCSVGTATFPQDADNYDDLFKLADHCLYVAKAFGRNRFIIYTKSMHGTIDSITAGKNNIQMVGYVSEGDKQKHLYSVVERVRNVEHRSQGLALFNAVLSELLHYYCSDVAFYSPVDPKEEHYILSNKDDIVYDDEIVKLYDTYKPRMDKHGCVAFGNYENTRGELPELFSYVKEHDYRSIFIARNVDKKGELKGVFVLMTKGRYQNWSNFDAQMLLIIFKLMEKYI